MKKIIQISQSFSPWLKSIPIDADIMTIPNASSTPKCKSYTIMAEVPVNRSHAIIEVISQP